MKRYLPILPLALIVALALPACGGGSSSSGGEEGAIEEAIETAATSTDPSKCSELQTAKFNEDETEKTGKAALKACEEEIENDPDPAESIDVSEVEVDGATATAVATVTGSNLNGQAVELELAKEGGDWKLNRFLSFADYEGKALAKVLEEELSKEGELPASAIRCVSERFAGLSKPEAEAIMIEHDAAAAEALFEGCH